MVGPVTASLYVNSVFHFNPLVPLFPLHFPFPFYHIPSHFREDHPEWTSLPGLFLRQPNTVSLGAGKLYQSVTPACNTQKRTHLPNHAPKCLDIPICQPKITTGLRWQQELEQRCLALSQPVLEHRGRQERLFPSTRIVVNHCVYHLYSLSEFAHMSLTSDHACIPRGTRHLFHSANSLKIKHKNNTKFFTLSVGK